MLPSLLPDSFPRQVRIVLVLPLNLGDFIFFYMAPFLLCLSSELYFWLQWIARETFWWDVVITKPALCSELSNVQQGSNRSPHPALRSASASRKELTSLCYQKEAAEFDLMPLIFFQDMHRLSEQVDQFIQIESQYQVAWLWPMLWNC